MRRRWQEWVIVVAIAALGVTGVMAIWGDQVQRVFKGEKKAASRPADGVAVPTPGNAAGPF